MENLNTYLVGLYPIPLLHRCPARSHLACLGFIPHPHPLLNAFSIASPSLSRLHLEISHPPVRLREVPPGQLQRGFRLGSGGC
jgi:hypothetical protein